MITDNTFEKLKKYFNNKAQNHKQHIKEKEITIQPFITISRETGAGGILLGEKLVSYLNSFDIERKCDWVLFDKNLLEKVSEDHKLSSEIVNLIPEKKIPEIQGIIEQFFGLHPSMSKLNRKVSETIIRLATIGCVVIIGRGANIITRKFNSGLHIRLISSKERKLENIKNLFNFSKKEATKFIEKEDKDRESFIKKNFYKDINDPSLYSMILNLATLEVDDAVEIIANQVFRMRKRI